MQSEGLEGNERLISETILKKRKKVDEQAKKRAQAGKDAQLKSKKRFDITFKRAEQYIKEFRGMALDRSILYRNAKVKNSYFVEPEIKLLLVVRIRGFDDVHPDTRTTLRLLRLRQIFHAVFIRVNKATLNMLKKVEPYVTYGYPSLKTVRELVFKRGFGKVKRDRVPLTENNLIEESLGKLGIICIEDLIHEIYSVGPNFSQANTFLWPFKLSTLRRELKMKRKPYVKGGDWGNRKDKINKFVSPMI